MISLAGQLIVLKGGHALVHARDPIVAVVYYLQQLKRREVCARASARVPEVSYVKEECSAI